MKLQNQEEISKIVDCPSQNESGTKTLYRFFSNNITEAGLKPYAVLNKPKLQHLCIAWGLSTYDSKLAAIEAQKQLPKKKRSELNVIAAGKIDDNDGIKYLSRNNGHYTLFPKEEINLLGKFELIDDE